MKSSRKVRKTRSLILNHTASLLPKPRSPVLVSSYDFLGVVPSRKVRKNGSLILNHTAFFGPNLLVSSYDFLGVIPQFTNVVLPNPEIHSCKISQKFRVYIRACNLVPGHLMGKLLEFSSIFREFV